MRLPGAGLKDLKIHIHVFSQHSVRQRCPSLLSFINLYQYDFITPPVGITILPQNSPELVFKHSYPSWQFASRDIFVFLPQTTALNGEAAGLYVDLFCS